VRPGEISLAHFGTLFLDEAPEFRGNVLQALREPLEDRVISISRADGPVHLPADFQLILAANPCPCGRLGMKTDGSRDGMCFCSSEEIRRYWRKFGGALLDRVELRVSVNQIDAPLTGVSSEESSVKIAERVLKAVEIQRERFQTDNTAIRAAQSAISPTRRNANMSPALIERCCSLTEEADRALRAASAKLGLSGRAIHGALRVARTIADLEGSDPIKTVHILEAIQHRRLGDDPYDILNG
jgi:magnesium chelatase family protein